MQDPGIDLITVKPIHSDAEAPKEPVLPSFAEFMEHDGDAPHSLSAHDSSHPFYSREG